MPWDLLNGGAITYDTARIFLTNRRFLTEDGAVPARSLGFVIGRSARRRPARGPRHHQSRPQACPLQPGDRHPLRLRRPVRGEVGADRPPRAHHHRLVGAEQRLRTTYRNQDFLRAVHDRHAPRRIAAPVYANGRLSFDVELEPGADLARLPALRPDRRRTAASAARTRCAHDAGRSAPHGSGRTDWQDAVLKIRTGNEEFYRFYRQAIEDMAALRLPIDGTDHMVFVPAAGLPWFVALFGRDSLIVSLQNILVYPEFARGALDVLGRWQAKQRDDYRDAEPGKIMHELRYGELAHFQLIPHTPYYGTADATPLYLIVLHAAWRATGDRALLDRQICRRAEGCLAWIDDYGDRDGDGFQEYQTRSPDGYENMAWKDAGDSMIYPDGSLVKGPKALCELQGYVYDAWLRMAEIFDELGEPGPRGRAARQGRRAVHPLQRRVLGRGQRLLRLHAGRREAAGADRRIQSRASAVVRHRAAGARRARGRPADGAGHELGLGHPHAVGGAPGVQSVLLPERLGLAARQRPDRARLQALRLRARGRRRSPATFRARPGISCSTNCRNSMPACSAARPSSRCSISAPTCRRPGPPVRRSRCCRRCWASSRTRRTGGSTSIPRCPPGCRTSRCTISGLGGTVSISASGGARTTATRFEVLRGPPHVVEPRPFDPLAAPGPATHPN